MIFFDIDTQNDFMKANGALYVPAAERIHANLATLLRAAEMAGVTTISTRCAHEPGDSEFDLFPPHCLEGTPGAERLFGELPNLPRQEVAVAAAAEPGARLRTGTHYVVRKKVFDLFSNGWLEGLRSAGVFRGEECVVFGVATDYCVRACVLGLVEAGARVRVVSDAISGVGAESTSATLADWLKAGVEMTTTSVILTELEMAKR